MKENLDARFDPTGNGLGSDILDVLESILRVHSMSVDELFIKWEVYCLKMGSEETRLDLETSRMFAKDVQDSVERGERAHQSGPKSAIKSERKNNLHATPRGGGNTDVFGLYVDIAVILADYDTDKSTGWTNSRQMPSRDGMVASSENPNLTLQCRGKLVDQMQAKLLARLERQTD